MTATSKNPFINIEDFDTPARCSAYRAIRYIAFQEKLVPETYSNECYGFKWYEQDSEQLDDVLFYQAQKALLAKLKNGDIVAYASTASKKEFPDEAPQVSFEETPMNEKLWVLHANDMNWHEGTLEIEQHSSYTYESYEYIFVRTHELFREFPLKTQKTESNKGRKEKYEWKSFIYPEITKYIYEGGELKSGQKVAEEIYSILSEKYGEDKTPPIETLRTEAIGPILRLLKFENK